MAHEHDDDHDDDEPREPVAHAASEHGPTHTDQSAWIDPTPTGEAEQEPDVVTYGEAGIFHEHPWTEGHVAKVVRPENHDDDVEVTHASRARRR